MARLNITIPDTLAERLEKYRDRLNLSRICADAIETEVNELETELERLETLRKDLSGMEELLERLRNERDETAKGQFAHGVEAAKEWVEGAHFSEIRKWGNDAGDLANAPYQPHVNMPDLPEEFGYRGEWWEEKDLWWKGNEDERRELGLEEPQNDEEWIEFARGFYTSLEQIWNTLEDKI